MQNVRHFNHILGLLSKKPNGFYGFGQPAKAEIQHFLGACDARKQGTSRSINADIGGLRRKGDRHQQRIGVKMIQLTIGFRVCGLKGRENLGHVMIV